MIESPEEAAAVFDPHKESLAHAVMTHATGNVLYERLSDIQDTLGFDLLTPSSNPNPAQRAHENQRRGEGFVAILMRRRNTDGMAGTPLMEEWIIAAIMLFLFQGTPKLLTLLPYAFMPGTTEFAALVADCTLPEIRHKFQQLENLPSRAVRAEVGSAMRLINAVFRSPAFAARCRGGFDLGAFLQKKGKLIVERGDDIGDDTGRTIMGAIVLLIIDHAKRRPKPYPPIRIYIDEATNAQLVGAPELRGIAETNKNGLYWEFLVQNLDFPGGSDAVLQNCLRHEWFGCPFHDLARKAAIDVAAGLPPTEKSRAERIAELTDDIMNLPPGWRWVRDPSGSRREYVPLLENPWPNWPGLREAKYQQVLQCIYSRPEYRVPAEPASPSSSKPGTRRSGKSPDDSSPANRLKRRRKKASRWLRKQRRRKRVHVRGVVYINAIGRPIVVYGRRCKADQLEHEVLITEVELLLARRFTRDAPIGKTIADAMFVQDGTHFYVEVDNQTMPPKQMRDKWLRYGDIDGFILVVCHTKARMRQLMRGGDLVKSVALFTRFRWLQSPNVTEPWIDGFFRRTGL